MRMLAIGLGLALALGFASPDSRAASVLGDAQKMGAGQVRSYAEFDADGKPAAWERSGLYPTEYCMRYAAAGKVTKVSLEGLVHRGAD